MRGVVALVLLCLAGCAGRPDVASAPPAPALPHASPPARPAPTPINAGLSEAATLWHLRAGLNVAALACRGPEAAATVRRYNRWIAHHAAALKTAEATYASEQATGGDGRRRHDDRMTRLYNFWAQAHGRTAFCAAAAGMLAALEIAPDPRAGAAARLAALDATLAPPWLPVDPSVFGGPLRVAAR